MLLLFALAGTGGVAEEQTPKTSLPRFAATKAKPSPFSLIRVNGMIAGMRNARAQDVIATFFPLHPVVGWENLPADRRFDVDLNAFETGPEGVLAGLGKALGLSIREEKATAEFLIVRNESNPVPKTWVRAAEQDLFDFGPGKGPHGITEVDATDHFHTAFYVTMPEFVHFLGDHAGKPVWNQTALLGRHSFSFRLNNENVIRTLVNMGFDAFIRTGTTRCVVVSKPQ